MASPKILPLNPFVVTIGDQPEDTYSTWAAAEADTDIDLVTATKSFIIEVRKGLYTNLFDTQMSGATTSASYHRVLKPMKGHSWQEVTGGRKPAADGSCVYIRGTTDTANSSIYIGESYSQVWDMAGDCDKGDVTAGYWIRTNVSGLDIVSNKYIGCYCVAYTCVNAVGRAYNLGHMTACINCILISSNQRGYLQNMNSPINEGIGYYYNCYCGVCSQYSFGANSGVNYVLAKNCIAATDMSGSKIEKTTCIEAATYGNIVFVDAANGDFHLAYNDATAKWQGTSLTADAVLPNDEDTDGVKRLGTWDIGAFQYRAEKLWGKSFSGIWEKDTSALWSK